MNTNHPAGSRAAIFAEIVAERERQDKIHPDYPTRNRSRQIAIITEELGEVAKAYLEGDDQGYRTELIQVAASAVRAIEKIADDTRPGLFATQERTPWADQIKPTTGGEAGAQ